MFKCGVGYRHMKETAKAGIGRAVLAVGTILGASFGLYTVALWWPDAFVFLQALTAGILLALVLSWITMDYKGLLERFD